MDRLFHSFSQIDASTTRKYGGTGLGLAISKRLAEMMGGAMWVESEVGRGATFFFTIRSQAAESALPVYLSPEQPTLRGKRVFIVDDNDTNQRILTLQTESWGMQAFTFASGASALDALRTDACFDVGLLDLQMPEMDGLDATRKIRQQQTLPGLRIIAMTANAMELLKQIEAAYPHVREVLETV